jgi:DNA-binding Xre family transcriptional regulator
MAVCYDKLFQLMAERKIRYTDLLTDASISGNVVTRMKRGEYVSMESLEKLCAYFGCKVDDILSFQEDVR